MILKQDTQEWLELRKKYIGASDAPIIMGVSPWRTKKQLWAEKVGLSTGQPENNAMRRGKRLEARARHEYINYTGTAIQPEIVFHPSKKFMMASLDGRSVLGDVVVEIKCPLSSADHNLAREGRVPEKYMPQLQHQLACTGLKIMHYFSYQYNSCALVQVERDDEYIEELYRAEEEFWKFVSERIEPPLTDKDFAPFLDREAAERYLARKGEFLKAKQLFEEAEEEIKAKAGDQQCAGYGIKITKCTVKGRINYNLIPQLEGVDLENYRSKPTTHLRITTN